MCQMISIAGLGDISNILTTWGSSEPVQIESGVHTPLNHGKGALNQGERQLGYKYSSPAENNVCLVIILSSIISDNVAPAAQVLPGRWAESHFKKVFSQETGHWGTVLIHRAGDPVQGPYGLFGNR